MRVLKIMWNWLLDRIFGKKRFIWGVFRGMEVDLYRHQQKNEGANKDGLGGLRLAKAMVVEVDHRGGLIILKVPR